MSLDDPSVGEHKVDLTIAVKDLLEDLGQGFVLCDIHLVERGARHRLES